MNHETMSVGSEERKTAKAGEVPSFLVRLDQNVEVLSDKLLRLFEKISPVVMDVPEKPNEIAGQDRAGASTQVGRNILATNDKVLRLISEVEEVISKVEL